MDIRGDGGGIRANKTFLHFLHAQNLNFIEKIICCFMTASSVTLFKDALTLISNRPTII